MDATKRQADTGRMQTSQKTIEELLAAARDMTQRTLGDAPGVVVAEVFRQLCYQNECRAPAANDDVARWLH